MSELVTSRELLDAFAAEVSEHWTVERELLATIAEILHGILVVTLKANGAKRTPPPFRVQRPGRGGPDAAPVSMGEYFSMVRQNQK